MVQMGDITIQDEAVILPSLKSAQTSRDSSVTGVQAITGVGFRPRAIWFLATVLASTGSMSFGFSENTIFSRNIRDREVVGAGTYSIEGGAISIYTSSGNIASALMTSFDIDGFTITWSHEQGSPTGTIQIAFMAIK